MNGFGYHTFPNNDKYIGYYYVKQNDKANAKIYFEQVTSLDPTDQEAVSNLTILNK